VIATRHHLHAQQTLAVWPQGSIFFCEKPLCLTEEDLAEIVRAYGRASSRSLMMVGFNRRFAPMSVQMRTF
jgi:predicted dehydrogenase